MPPHSWRETEGCCRGPTYDPENGVCKKKKCRQEKAVLAFSQDVLPTAGSETTNQACNEMCIWTDEEGNSRDKSQNGYCDDGGPGSAYSFCSLGTDCTDCGVRGDREDECETKCGSDPTCFAYDVSTDGTSFLCHTYHVPIPGTMNGCSDQTIPPACFIRLDLLPPSAPPTPPAPPAPPPPAAPGECNPGPPCNFD